MTKEYQVSDLFYTAWKDLDDLHHLRVYELTQALASLQKGSIEYGLVLISILRLLRKNKRLVNKINEAQAVDIFNDLTFLHEPWYYFPTLPGLKKPDPHLARCSFDEFIYADNEFSSYIAAEGKDNRFLRRLVVTLYRTIDEPVFDKETVEEREAEVKISRELLLMFFTYAHVREKIMKRCKTLLPKPIQSAEVTVHKTSPTGAMWHNIKHQAAKTLVFGDFTNVGRTNMYDVLDHLELLCKEKEDKRGKH